ncbi:MAG: GWxTD domain-containing protein [Bacteroidales bacterium]|jgi:GWxTD domain-containing protein|nr:GWxTD domain-containing protein [Bacteroidales bacterium]
MQKIKFQHHIFGLAVNCLLICLAAAILSGCNSRKKNVLKVNKPILYNPASTSLHPNIGVFHLSETESQMFISLNTNELIVNEANEERVPKAEVKIHYELYDCTETENNKIVTDSATFFNILQIKKTQKSVVFPITFPAVQGRRYMLSVQMTDVFRRNTIRKFITVNKTNEFSGQNFRVIALNGSPKLDNMINENEIFRIIYQRRPVDSIFIKYMAAPGAIATSPLSSASAEALKFKADSVWVQAYSPTTNFMFGYEGLYLIQTDTMRQDGLLLMNFGAAFPKENRTAKLVEPISYLVNNSEYQKLTEAGNPKKMMDNFWLAATGSTDKARMLIRVFYTRMGYANQYFTDVKEGWKTDRGVVYMVYGLPNNVLKSSDSETWEYTREHQNNSVTFTFDRKDSPYSDDHFVLRRGDPQTTYWARAIDSWRKGRVFSLSEID